MKKRITALILTLSLVLSMGISVFAADSPATITITDEDGNVLDIDGTITLTGEGSGKTAEELEAELEELEYLDSSYGFFVWLSENDSITEAQREEAATAADVLTGTLGDVPTYSSSVATYEELVEALPIGEGATSMENLLAGINMVEFTNELRQYENEEEGKELDDYLISPILTACEELVINYNAAYTYTDGHLGVFKFPSENLVSGSISLLPNYSWAFYYWYTVEKSYSGGHYCAIVASNIETVGAAGTSYGSRGYYGMAFNLDSYTSYTAKFGYTENAYTTEEFYALATEYQEYIDAEIETAEDELESIGGITADVVGGEATADISDGTYTATVSGLDGHGTVTATVTVSGGAATVVLTDEDAESITEHDYTAATTEATCTEDGETVYTCSVCGDTYTETIAATGHSYDGGIVTEEATCTEDGTVTYTCILCGDTYTETIAATGHSYDGGTVTKEADEDSDGIITYTCSACGDTYTETVRYSGSGSDGDVQDTESGDDTDADDSQDTGDGDAQDAEEESDADNAQDAEDADAQDSEDGADADDGQDAEDGDVQDAGDADAQDSEDSIDADDEQGAEGGESISEILKEAVSEVGDTGAAEDADEASENADDADADDDDTEDADGTDDAEADADDDDADAAEDDDTDDADDDDAADTGDAGALMLWAVLAGLVAVGAGISSKRLFSR